MDKDVGHFLSVSQLFVFHLLLSLCLGFLSILPSVSTAFVIFPSECFWYVLYFRSIQTVLISDSVLPILIYWKAAGALDVNSCITA